MLKVYCDTGAYRPELTSLEQQGKVRVFQFKYENKNRHIRHRAAPSRPTYKELNYTYKELGGLTYNDLGKTSDKRKAIEAAFGANNIRDAKHLDSAHMEGCTVFLTSDKGDIVSRRGELASRLGLRVLHFHEDWNEFLALVAEDESIG